MSDAIKRRKTASSSSKSTQSKRVVARSDKDEKEEVKQPVETDPMEWKASIESEFELISIDQLLQEKPHLGIDAQGRPLDPQAQAQLLANRRQQRSSSSSDVKRTKKKRQTEVSGEGEMTEDEIQLHHTQQSSFDPQSHPQLGSLLQTMGERYYRFVLDYDRDCAHQGECTPAMLDSARVRLRQVQTVRGGALESALLRQSGRFPHPRLAMEVEYPACVKGQECVCFDWHVHNMSHPDKPPRPCPIPGLTEPIVLMSSLDQLQYEQFLRDGIWPIQALQMCVLCWRYRMAALVLKNRRGDMNCHRNPMGRPNDSIEPGYIEDLVKQIYRNPVDEENGYAREFVLQSAPTEYLLQPIVLLNTSRLKAVYDETERRWSIDQTAILWQQHADVTPVIGEKASNF
jgi:hypothetical protein